MFIMVITLLTPEMQVSVSAEASEAARPTTPKTPKSSTLSAGPDTAKMKKKTTSNQSEDKNEIVAYKIVTERQVLKDLDEIANQTSGYELDWEVRVGAIRKLRVYI